MVVMVVGFSLAVVSFYGIHGAPAIVFSSGKKAKRGAWIVEDSVSGNELAGSSYKSNLQLSRTILRNSKAKEWTTKIGNKGEIPK